MVYCIFFFFSSRRRHTSLTCDWSSDVCSSDLGELVWSEWEMSGTRRDGTMHQMAGVILFGVRDGSFSWARFYLEPVQTGGAGVDAAVRRHVRAGPAAGSR